MERQMPVPMVVLIGLLWTFIVLFFTKISSSFVWLLGHSPFCVAQDALWKYLKLAFCATRPRLVQSHVFSLSFSFWGQNSLWGFWRPIRVMSVWLSDCSQTWFLEIRLFSDDILLSFFLHSLLVLFSILIFQALLKEGSVCHQGAKIGSGGVKFFLLLYIKHRYAYSI